MTVNLTGVTDVQQITVSLSNVTDTFAQISSPTTAVSMNVLAGDTNGSKTVSAADVSQTKAQAGAPITSANFRQDVTPTARFSSVASSRPSAECRAIVIARLNPDGTLDTAFNPTANGAVYSIAVAAGQQDSGRRLLHHHRRRESQSDRPARRDDWQRGFV